MDLSDTKKKTFTINTLNNSSGASSSLTELRKVWHNAISMAKNTKVSYNYKKSSNVTNIIETT